jgi:hypothetical protein
LSDIGNTACSKINQTDINAGMVDGPFQVRPTVHRVIHTICG